VAAALLVGLTSAFPLGSDGGDSVELLQVGQPLAALHSQNTNLLAQINHISGGGQGPPPAMAAPQGPSMGALEGMMASAPQGGGGEGRMAGIKEALTAVKPIMDKYVNTAKTLTGKYAALKAAYSKLKQTKGSNPEVEHQLKAEMKMKENEDKKQMNELEETVKATKAEEAKQAEEAEKEELGLKQKSAQLEANNHAVAHSFFTELENARKAAKNEINGMKQQLNHFMAATNHENFDAIGKETERAIEERKTLQYKAQDVQNQVKDALAQEAKEELAAAGGSE